MPTLIIMKYRLLGRSGLRVSDLALGTMTFSEENPWNFGVTKEASEKIMKTYAEAGGNFLDTANNYQNGQSEKVIGEFIEGDRDRYVIATKYSLKNLSNKNNANSGGNHKKNLLRTVEASLDRLNTDYIDLLYLHIWDYTTSIREIVKTLDSLVQKTKVNYVAISDSPTWAVAQAVTLAEERGWEPFTAFQIPFNIGEQNAQHEVLPFCRYNDIAMVPWNVLGSGLYTGKYTRNAEEEKTGRITQLAQLGNLKTEKNLLIAKTIDEIADELEVPSAAVTVAWTRAQDTLMIPLIGATKPNHITEAIEGTNIALNEEQMKRLDEVASFKPQYPQTTTGREFVRQLLFGEEIESIYNHRFRGF